MSADNYVMLRKHPDGGFALLHGFASEDVPPNAHGFSDRFDTIEAACKTYATNDYYISEYGLRIHSECFGPKEHRFMVSIFNGNDVPRTLITVTGHPDSGYSVRNYDPELDGSLHVAMATPTVI